MTTNLLPLCLPLWLLLSLALRIVYWPSALRTGIVLIQPDFDAGRVKPVLARQNGHLGTHFGGIHTNGAFGLALGAQHLLIDLLLGKMANGILWSWWWSTRAGILIDQLRDNAVKFFLRVCGIAVSVKVE